ncbi:MAG: glycerate 2-kinase [Candidatus Atribacteria bacterium]|nr:glycerate 2-kinase [Candidatus Atribacteria bacterium]
MRILVAPDSFKGSLKSTEVALLIKKGLQRVDESWLIVERPLADGGEGTVEVLVQGTKGKMIEKEVTGPRGEKVKAHIGVVSNGEVAVLEMAEVAGLTLLLPEERNPRFTTTYGVGELIKEAVNLGFCRIILGIGGSATNDGGMGALRALGVKFFDREGRELRGIGDDLINLARIDSQHLFEKPEGVELIIACDVKNPLYGEEGAAYVYGPQKGANPEEVEMLDRGLRNYARLVKEHTGIEIDHLPGAGAAGGIGAGLYAFWGAEFVSGIQLVMDILGVEEEIKKADLVISGEGKVDKQSLYGKVVSGVREKCDRWHKPLILVGGKITEEAFSLWEDKVLALFSITNGPMSEEEAFKKAPFLLEHLSFNLGRVWKGGAMYV